MGPVRLQLLVVCVACAICMLCFAQDQESAVHAKTGGAAELGCSLSLPTPPLLPLHVVEWVRQDFDVPVLIKFGPYAPRVHPSFEHRVSLSRDAALRVQPVQLQDEGWFECRILRLNRTTAGSVNGTWIFLSVSAPPEFTKTPPPVIQVMQGDSLGLTCAAQGNPHPTITWTKDDMAIGKGQETVVVDGTLTVGAVTRQMAGVYKCHVSNTEGSLTHATQLKVKGPPAILLPPKDTTLNMSQKAELQCRAEAYPPNMTYVWWRHGENVYHIDSLKSRVKILVDGTLLIPNLIPEDSGNYTCMPTNGLLTPPTASAYLTVKHPAQVVQMAQVTYLPAGMGGRIICPVRADPPLLSVSWTKDGRVLDLNMFPGWMLMADGSLFLAAANEDAVGTYSCTPYNSYGTLGPSPPTQVVLQDPPVFSVHPQEEYEQEVGTKLVIPCHAHGDPSPSITWAKLDRAARSPYTVAANGSLVVEPLSKDHHGVWECVATNRVGTVTASTTVSVLGTSPHAVSSVMVYPGTNQVNVSWEPGFNGGYTQKFTVWMKQTLEPKSKWVSLSTPVPAPPLLVTGLLPGTQYQFSVLPHNRVGTGPFSVMVRVQTLVPLTDLPPTVTMTPELAPPISLSANQSMIGIVLKWVPPPPQGAPLTGFILQSRQKGEIEWNILEGDIGANDSEILLQGLQKDCSYELRMLSLRDGVMSMPSQPLNISTAGIGALHVRLLEGDPEPHVAGVLAGVGVLCAVVLLVMGTACFLNRNKRRRQRQKKREDISSALQKCPSDNRSGARPDSPDSVLKMKACLLNTIFPKSHPDLSSSDDSGSREDQDQDKQLLSQLRPKSSLWGCAEGEGATARPTATLESISRGPDGRFVVRPCKDGPDIPECPGGGGGGGFSHWDCRRSCSLCSERDDLAVVLAVDLPDISTSCSDSDSCTDSSGSDPAGTFAQWSRRHSSLLPQDRAWDVVDGGALVTQMEREKESGHLSRCLTLVREREALERELEHCEARLSSRAWRRETGGTPGPQEGRRQGDPQLREKDCHPPDPRRAHHSGADAARPEGSDSSCLPRRSTHITSVSSCVPAPHLESGAGPYTYASLPTNPESTCLLSDSMKARSCHWGTPSEGSVSKPTKEAGSGKGRKDRDSFSQNSTDPFQWHLLQGGDEEGGWDNEGLSSGSTWPYRRGRGGEAHKTRVAESLGITLGGSSTPSFPESEKEVVRCGKSSLTSLMANDDCSSPPDFSVSQISGFVRPNLTPQHYEMSQLHTDPILKYLSLPGFVEMNVDEPVDENDTVALASGLESSQRPGDVFPSELKVVPAVRAANTQKDREAGLRTQTGDSLAAGPGLSSREESHQCPAQSGAAGLCGRMGSSQKQLPSPDRTLRHLLKRSQSLTCESPAGRGGRPLSHLSDQTGQSDRERPNWHWSLASDQALTWTTQDPRTQGSRIHLLPSVCDPVPHGRSQGLRGCGQATTVDMSKTLSRGRSRTKGKVPPDPVVWKTASLRMPTREHRAIAENPMSQASCGAEFPSPEVWVRSLSLGCTSKSRPEPLRGTHLNSEEPPTRSSPLQHLPPVQQRPPASPDPHRPFNPPNWAPDHPVPLPPRWSRPGHAPFTQREPVDRVKQQGNTGRCMEEAMDGSKEEEEGRGSYASQSSGRGSLGPLSGPSPSPSPTLPSSPETIQESKAGERRRVSVDENYEWDATIIYLESDARKASGTGPNQDREGVRGCPHPKDHDSKGDPLRLSSCVLKYQISPGSTCSRTRDPDAVLF